MTASVETTNITNGQIEDLVDKLRAATRKHRREIPKDFAQQALGVDNLGMRLFTVFRDLVETMASAIIRIVKVDRILTHEQQLAATGRKQYVSADVVAAMPRGEGSEVTLVYFKPDESAYDKNGWLSPAALTAEYEKRGLVPDPDAQAADNAANPAFADQTPNACQWQDADGNFCYASFYRWLGERHVYVRRFDRVWFDSWSFAGRRK